jgi:NSS family neurotransmitter:Na+ symporter
LSQSTGADFQHEKWSSSTVFMLATIGAAVGLGNLWRFPYIAGQNGGAAFVLIYVGFVLLLGVPVMMAELAMGRRGQGSPVASMRKLVSEAGTSRAWASIGWISITIPLLGMSYYSIVGGWSIDYVFKAASNSFANINGQESGDAFGMLIASPGRLLFFHGLFIASGVIVVARGIGKGIEAVSRYMMPALFAILVILVVNSIFNADIARGTDFLLNPQFDKITPTVVFMALGQAFFSLAIGVGVMLTYGAYVPKSGGICKRTGSCRRAGADIRDLADSVRQYAGWLYCRSIVFHPAVFRSLFLGSWDAGTASVLSRGAAGIVTTETGVSGRFFLLGDRHLGGAVVQCLV